MGICYFCGRELVEARRCPHCNLTFCPEHMPQRAHNCIALSREFRVQPGTPQQAPEEEMGEPEPPPMGAHPHRVRYSTAEPEEEQQRQAAKPRIRVDGLKLVAFVAILALGTWSMNSLLNMKDETSSAEPIFPVSQETKELQDYALKLINTERTKAGFPPLILDANPLAQRFAEELARTNNLEHNLQLPVNMGESIRQYEIITPYSLKDVIAKNVDALINNDAANKNGNRDLLLHSQWSKASIGIATNKRYFYLVFDLSSGL